MWLILLVFGGIFKFLRGFASRRDILENGIMTENKQNPGIDIHGCQSIK